MKSDKHRKNWFFKTENRIWGTRSGADRWSQGKWVRIVRQQQPKLGLDNKKTPFPYRWALFSNSSLEISGVAQTYFPLSIPLHSGMSSPGTLPAWKQPAPKWQMQQPLTSAGYMSPNTLREAHLSMLGQTPDWGSVLQVSRDGID